MEGILFDVKHFSVQFQVPVKVYGRIQEKVKYNKNNLWAVIGREGDEVKLLWRVNVLS